MNRLSLKKTKRRLLVASNRLPIAVDISSGKSEIRDGSGGLVTALAPIIGNAHGMWIGWPGCELTPDVENLLNDHNHDKSFDLYPVNITADEAENYYRGFSNQAIWPLFHDLLGQCKFDTGHWEAYRQVNRRFAEKIVEVVQPGDLIWIHDYHLMLVAHYLRQMNIRHPLAFFLHIPFPTHDLLRRLPWKNEIVRALLEYDLVGFQTLRDRRNFTRTAKELLPELEINAKYRHSDIHFGLRSIKAGHYPISIDFSEFNDAAQSDAVALQADLLKRECQTRSLILGVDRLDYTKGIPERLMAYERALEKYPDLQGNVCLLQLAVPSRARMAAYMDIREKLERMVGRINGRFSKFGWQAIQYIYRSLSRDELLGCYRACDIGLLTPLRDGMNLVAKEYCASTVDNNGVLILSEFAGASEQLSRGAIVVNPYNLEETADAIYRAYTMDPHERERRMSILRAEVKRNDIYRWLEWFLSSFEGREMEEPVSSALPYGTLGPNVRVEHKHLPAIVENGIKQDQEV